MRGRASAACRKALFPAVLLVQPASAQTADPADGDIVVVAPAASQGRTDREVYTVKDNAQVQTETGLQLMRHVPAVTVDSQDQVQLLGDPHVKILIDGHPVTNGSRALKALPAGQIARVEVLTNPSAAFSAEGTAGVINIVTRQLAKPGIGGAATITRDGFGGAIAKLAPTISAGRLSAALAFTLDDGGFRNDVTEQRTADDPAESFAARRHNDARNDDFTAHAEVTYKAGARRIWTLTLDHQDDAETNLSAQDTLSRGSTLYPLVRDTRSLWGYRNDSGSLAYAWTGARQGEGLTVSAAYVDTRAPTLDQVDEDYGGSSQFSLLQHDDASRSAELKADYTHPFRKADLLSTGLSVVRARRTQLDGLAAAGDNLVSLPFGPERIGGTWTTTAAYATLQFPVGRWTVLPGMRLEDRAMDAPDLGPDGRRNDLFLFPSLHADRRLTKRLDLGLSYSRRVEWPALRQLDPSIHYYNPTDGTSGNPALRPQLTDAVEASFAYKLGKQNLSLKLYDRETAHAWLDDATLLPNGVGVTTVANIGSLRRLGGELGLQGALGKSWHLNTSIDLLARRSVAYEDGRIAPEDEFTYSGNAQLEYQTKADGAPGANHLELAVQYLGPTRSFQTRSSSYTVGSLTWTHSIDARLSTAVKMNDLFAGDGGSFRVVGDDYRQVNSRLDDKRRVTASLICRLGRLH